MTRAARQAKVKACTNKAKPSGQGRVTARGDKPGAGDGTGKLAGLASDGLACSGWPGWRKEGTDVKVKEAQTSFEGTRVG